MSLKVTLSNHRCFFNPFNSESDRNLKTGRAGLKYYNKRFIGVIFKMLGLAYSIKGKMDGKKFTLYINKNSFKKWIERHAKDPTFEEYKRMSRLIISKELDIPVNKISKLDIKKYIYKITDNCRDNLEVLAKRVINPGKLLSVEKVMDKAKSDFRSHADKEEVLNHIQDFLNYVYVKDIRIGIPPYFYNPSTWYESYHLLPSDERNRKRDIYFTALKFMTSLPGVDTTPYDGVHNL